MLGAACLDFCEARTGAACTRAAETCWVEYAAATLAYFHAVHADGALWEGLGRWEGRVQRTPALTLTRGQASVERQTVRAAAMSVLST